MCRYLIHNGKLIQSDQPILKADNRGYRYGDGLFETMKLINERIILEDYHFERLLSGLQLLLFQLPAFFTKKKIQEEVLLLCKENGCEESARIRLSVSRGYGGIYEEDNKMEYIIETRALDPLVHQFNSKGISIDIYYGARKICDIFSNLKSANYLPYVMAALYAKQNNLDDSILLNSYNRLCDTTIANIFVVKSNSIFTPPLSEGCVSGVMRKYIIEKLQRANYKIHEKPLTDQDMENADEIFLTNAITGIRWVNQFRKRTYSSVIGRELYEKYVSELYI